MNDDDDNAGTPAGGPEPLTSVTAIVPFVNEVRSVATVIGSLLGDPRCAVGEILVVTGSRTTPASAAALEALAAGAAGRVKVLRQALPG
jgi:hypothetical protein